MIESDGVVGDRHSGTQKAAGTRNELTFFSFALLCLHLFWYQYFFVFVYPACCVFVFADIVIQDIQNCFLSLLSWEVLLGETAQL